MALKSTIFKADLNVADTDRQVYGDFPLTVACHPSETTQRMMLRILAFALHAGEGLAFGRGISTDDEPDLWQRDLTNRILLWVELGTPDPDRLRKASARSDRVVLYAYGDRAVSVWWDKHGSQLGRLDQLTVYRLDDEVMRALGNMAQPGMALQCTVADGEAWLSDGRNSLAITPQRLQ